MKVDPPELLLDTGRGHDPAAQLQAIPLPASRKPRSASRHTLVVILFAALLQSCSNNAQPSQPAPENWKINGALAALEDGRGDVRREALEKLRELKDPATIKHISSRLNESVESDESVRVAAIRALGAMGGESREHASKIAGFLKKGSGDEMLAAVSALGSMGEAAQDHVEDLVKLVNETRTGVPPEVIINALGVLAKEGWHYRPEVKDLLKETIVKWSRDANPTYPSAREEAIKARGRIGAVAPDHLADHITYLVSLLDGAQTNDSCVRQAAGIALCEIGERAAQHLPGVMDLLNEKSDCRADVVKAVGKMGSPAEGYASRVDALLNDPDQSIRGFAARSLVSMTQGVISRTQVSKIANLLESDDPYVRNDAVSALSEVKETDWSVVKQMTESQSPTARAAALIVLGRVEPNQQRIRALIQLLKEPVSMDRAAAAEALIAAKSRNLLGFDDVLRILNLTYDPNADSQKTGELLFLAHYLGGGHRDTETIIRWLRGDGGTKPPHLTYQNASEILAAFERAWNVTKSDKDSYRYFLDDLKGRMDQFRIDSFWERWRGRIGWGLVGHLLFWVALIFLYPKSPHIQAILFWNPWMRRITGLGYVGFALAWVPYLRAKLFAPFKDSLLADAAIEGFDPQTYFAESVVKGRARGTSWTLKPVREAIPEIKKQIVLEGESGLGKTMFLKHLVSRSGRLVVYLPAEKCDRGVIEAIQAKLQGPSRESDFLRNLIYSGALDICIDGLNEVSADTRAKITEFVESYFKGNIIMATQRMEWKPPATARTYVLQPLKPDQIEEFLLSREQSLPPDAPVLGAAYEQACRDYLAEALSVLQPAAVLDSARKILSNPMDLTVITELLARGEKPDLSRLLEQQYEMMAADYRNIYPSADFPLRAFSERVYQMRLDDKSDLPEEEFPQELPCLERNKMVVTRQTVMQGHSVKRWYLRHDKIREFFIAQTFLGKDDKRTIEHLRDPRFRGVYLLLATMLPLDEARILRDLLTQDAADTRDHTLSDQFIQLLRAREHSVLI